jgi:hypothetical protein
MAPIEWEHVLDWMRMYFPRLLGSGADLKRELAFGPRRPALPMATVKPILRQFAESRAI